MHSRSIAEFVFVFVCVLPAARSSSSNGSDREVMTMRREESNTEKSLSVGENGDLHAAAAQLKDFAKAEVDAENFKKLLEDMDDEEVHVDDVEDHRSLLQVRKFGKSACQKSATSSGPCNALTSPQCGWATKNQCGYNGADGKAVTSCCRDCQVLKEGDCKASGDAGGQCQWKSSKCGYTASSMAETTYNGSTANGGSMTSSTTKEDENESLSNDSALKLPAAPSAEADKVKDSLMDDEKENEDQSDARGLLSMRIDGTFDSAGCKTLATAAADCNKASTNQCGWANSTSQCRDCAALSKADCDLANNGGSKCAWSTGACKASSSLLQDVTATNTESTDLAASTQFDATVKDHEYFPNSS